MRTGVLSVLGALLVMSTSSLAPAQPADPIVTRAPLVCSHGPGGEFFEVRATLPATAPTGSVYTVRLVSFPAPPVTDRGLNYLHDMVTDYYLPSGASYVPGSARVVDGTGTENVRRGARAWAENGYVRLYLPAHIDKGSGFTPPSVEFQVRVAARPGESLPIRVVRYRVRANVVVAGNVDVVCKPRDGAYTIGTTVVTPAPAR